MASCWWYHSALTNGCFILEALKFALLIESETSGPRINRPWWSVPERKRWDIIYVYNSCRANAISSKNSFNRPKRSCCKVMFLHPSVIHRRWGCLPHTQTPWADTPLPSAWWDTPLLRSVCWDTVNKRAVCILLKCILIFDSETTDTWNCVYTGTQQYWVWLLVKKWHDLLQGLT